MTTSRTDAMFNSMSPQKQMKQSWRQRTGGGFLFGDDPNGAAQDGSQSASTSNNNADNSADTTATLRRYEERCVQLGIEPRAEIWTALSTATTAVTVGEVALSVHFVALCDFAFLAFIVCCVVRMRMLPRSRLRCALTGAC
jgi:hypothetical protein